MATFIVPINVPNLTASAYLKVKYRLSGSSTWTTYNIASSGTTTSFQGTNNLLYDVQVTNVNNNDNPSSAILQGIGISDPTPLLSPTNVTLGYSFANLSGDMDTYTCSIAEFTTPGQIITTHILPAGSYPGTITDIFIGLQALTEYILSITPAANQFFKTFTYTFTTAEIATCAAPTAAIAILV